jgi:general secretion pathway protein E
MLDMGVEDYLLTSTVNGILAQRLVRRLDKSVATPFEAMPEVVREYKLDTFTDERPIRLYKPGSSPTNPTGYFGRTTIMEFLVMSDALRRLIMQHAGMGEIEEQARREGMRTMFEDGLVKSLQGQTTIEEVLRVTSSEG